MNIYRASYVYADKEFGVIVGVIEVPERYIKASSRKAAIKLLEGDGIKYDNILNLTRVTKDDIRKRIVKMELNIFGFKKLIGEE